MSKNNTVSDYLDWRGELSFMQSPVNEIDALIFSIFAYLNFSHIQDNEIEFFKNAIDKIQQLPDEQGFSGMTFLMPSVLELADKAAKTRRFRDIGVSHFSSIIDEEIEMQFAAVTFLLPDQTAFLAYRGTDNTLVGWKEDFNMSFMNGIPAQIEAARYASSIASSFPMPLRLGGHSKGGNLAVWAAANLTPEYQERILTVYNNDGPGFNEAFLGTSSYLSIRNKILSFVPESSIVGVLMAHDDYITIQSSESAIMQHNPFSWLLLGSHFLYGEKRSRTGRRFEKIVNSWMENLSLKERENLIESLYDIITSSNAKTLDDLDRNKLQALIQMQKTYLEMAPKKQLQLLASFNRKFKKEPKENN